MKNVLLMTDKRSLPGIESYYAISHTLLRNYYDCNKNSLNFSLTFDTPDRVVNDINHYDAVIDRTLVYTPDVMTCHRLFSESAVPYLNSPALMSLCANKTALYKLLNDHEINQPKTYILDSFEQFERILNSHEFEHIVVKPEYGGMGTDVFFIDYTDTDLVARWKERLGDEVNAKTYSGSHLEFYNKFIKGSIIDTSGTSRSSMIGGKTWIIQEMLDIVTNDGCVFDIRIIEQRNGDGILEITGAYGRQSNSKGISLTNLDKGGIVIFDIFKFLTKFGLTKTSLYEMCRKVDSCIEKAVGPIGEIGHDIAIVKDSSGKFKFYYIEGNTMPGYALKNWKKIKKVPNLNFLTDNEHNLFSNPLSYCGFLLSHPL